MFIHHVIYRGNATHKSPWESENDIFSFSRGSQRFETFNKYGFHLVCTGLVTGYCHCYNGGIM